MTEHVHHWLLGRQEGPVSLASCTGCDEEKAFLTAGPLETGREALSAKLRYRPPLGDPELVKPKRLAFGTYRMGRLS